MCSAKGRMKGLYNVRLWIVISTMERILFLTIPHLSKMPLRASSSSTRSSSWHSCHLVISMDSWIKEKSISKTLNFDRNVSRIGIVVCFLLYITMNTILKRCI